MKGSGGDGGDMMKMKMRMGMGRCDLAQVGIVREHRPEGHRLENVRRNQDQSARNIKDRLR